MIWVIFIRVCFVSWVSKTKPRLSSSGQTFQLNHGTIEAVIYRLQPSTELVIPPVAVTPDPLCIHGLIGIDIWRQNGVILFTYGTNPRFHIAHVMKSWWSKRLLTWGRVERLGLMLSTGTGSGDGWRSTSTTKLTTTRRWIKWSCVDWWAGG